MHGTSAPLLKVKTKYQITLPTTLREKVDLSVGDLLEAKVEGKKIVLTPKRAVDRELALALEDFKHGRYIGPFNTAKSAGRALRRAVKSHK